MENWNCWRKNILSCVSSTSNLCWRTIFLSTIYETTSQTLTIKGWSFTLFVCLCKSLKKLYIMNSFDNRTTFCQFFSQKGKISLLKTAYESPMNEWHLQENTSAATATAFYGIINVQKEWHDEFWWRQAWGSKHFGKDSNL